MCQHQSHQFSLAVRVGFVEGALQERSHRGEADAGDGWLATFALVTAGIIGTLSNVIPLI